MCTREEEKEERREGRERLTFKSSGDGSPTEKVRSNQDRQEEECSRQRDSNKETLRWYRHIMLKN